MSRQRHDAAETAGPSREQEVMPFSEMKNRAMKQGMSPFSEMKNVHHLQAVCASVCNTLRVLKSQRCTKSD